MIEESICSHIDYQTRLIYADSNSVKLTNLHCLFTQKVEKKTSNKGKNRKGNSKHGLQKQQAQSSSGSGEKPTMGLFDLEESFEPVQVTSISDIKNLNDFQNQWIELDRNFVKSLFSLTSTEHLQHYQLGYLNQDLNTVYSLVSI